MKRKVEGDIIIKYVTNQAFVSNKSHDNLRIKGPYDNRLPT